MSTYKELYCLYKEYVVLMLKKYMYVGHDDSARVLSVLLEYKLFESPDGIASCGPNKDKIMGVLSNHHVNYVISEYGKITEEKSFSDNQFSIYLPLAANTAIETCTQENMLVPDSLAEISVPDWFVEGLPVIHHGQNYGAGTIQTIKKNATSTTFSVLFSENKLAWFLFPDIFDSGTMERA